MNMKKIYFLMLSFFLLSIASMNVTAQVTIGDLGDPHEGAVLHLKSGGSKGLLLPQVSLSSVNIFSLDESANDPASSAIGMVVYNTNESITGGKGKGTYVWSGTEWMLIGEGTIPSVIQVTSISISGDDRVDAGGSINLTATVSPANVSNKTVIWTVSNGTGSASIDALSGKLTGTSSGIVYVTATAIDGSGVSAVKEVTVNPVAVTSISIIGSSTVAAGSSITLDVEVTPAEATNKNVTWSVINGTGSAVIDATRGILLGISSGTVTVIATAQDGSGITALKTITIEETNIPVSSITISGSTSVNVGSSITLSATISPSNASNTGITWTVTNGTGNATINSTTGVLTGVTAGSVTVTATAQDGSGKSAIHVVNITAIPMTNISISGSTSVNIGNSIALSASVSPSNATNKNVTWSVTSGSAYATVSTYGVVTGVAAGSATIRATAADGSGIYATHTVTVNPILVTSISISGSSSTTIGNTIALSASVSPSNATNKNVTWSVTSGNAYATVSTYGVVTGVAAGSATIRATAADGSGIYGTKTITITSPAPSNTTAAGTVYTPNYGTYLNAISPGSTTTPTVVKPYYTSTGKTLYIENSDASDYMHCSTSTSYCANKGMRLPTLYELAQFQNNYSSYGFRSTDYYYVSDRFTTPDGGSYEFSWLWSFGNGHATSTNCGWMRVRCVWSE